MSSVDVPAAPESSAPVPRSRRSRWLRRLVPWLCLYSLWLVMCFGCHFVDSAVLFPSNDPIPLRWATEQSIPVAGGGRLQVWSSRSRAAQTTQPAAFVLEFTGNATRAEEAVESSAWTWGAHPVEVWVVNYPGYGGSTGPARLKAVASTALEAYDALRAVAGERPIFVAGTSLGSTAALHVAAHRPAAGMLIINPPALRQLVRGEFGWWNLWLLATPASFCIPAELDSIRNASRVTVPGVCMTSRRDTVVPYRYQERVVSAYAGPKRIIDMDADHNDAWSPSDQRRLASEIDWLWATAIGETNAPP